MDRQRKKKLYKKKMKFLSPVLCPLRGCIFNELGICASRNIKISCCEVEKKE